MSDVKNHVLMILLIQYAKPGYKKIISCNTFFFIYGNS